MDFITSPSEINTAEAAAPVVETNVAPAAVETPAVKAAKRQQNPDVRSFTGYIACDGSTHKTAKDAVTHSEQVKVTNALSNLALAATANPTAPTGVSVDERGFRVIFIEDLPVYLAAHRAEITAAFSQVVKVRAPRGSKKAAATQAAVGPAETA